MHDELKEAIANIQRAAKENGKSTGIYSTSGDQAQEYADQGFHMVCICRTKRAVLWPMTFLTLGICDDRYGCTPSIYDIFFGGCQRLVCAFGAEYGKRRHVRNIQNGGAVMFVP